MDRAERRGPECFLGGSEGNRRIEGFKKREERREVRDNLVRGFCDGDIEYVEGTETLGLLTEKRRL